MKKIITILVLILIFNSNVYTQCEYADFSDAPEELFRKRVNEPSMRYGNPYTMFVKGNDFNLDTEDSCGLTVQWQPLLCVPTNNI